MSTRTNLALVSLAATLLMAFAVSSASAGRLSSSNQNIRLTFRQMRFFGEGGIAATVKCPVTVEGSFHERTFNKVVRTLVGTITRAIAASRPQCTGGAATILATGLPWHYVFEGFIESLPTIAGLQFFVRRTGFLIEIGLGTTCLYAENGTAGAKGTMFRDRATGRITSFDWDESIRLPLISGSFGCPPEAGIGDRASVTLLGTTNSIEFTLI